LAQNRAEGQDVAVDAVTSEHAIDHTSDTLALAVEELLIVVETLGPMRENEEMILVEICDDGPGVPADIVETAFNPYFTTKPFGERTGLGLDAVGT
jgi:C4-dicarboxylate-specific signal transduction histidine kinase